MKTRIIPTFLLAVLCFGAGPVLAQSPLDPPPVRPLGGPNTKNAAAASFYDSRAKGNDFSGAKTLADLGFSDVHGGVASFNGGSLVLTPDGTNGGTDAFSRDYVLREGGGEQVRDLGCRVVLPANYRTGEATIGVLLRFQREGNGLLLNFAPEAGPSLIAYSSAGGAATRRGEANLSTPYVAANPVALEARVVADAAVALTVTDLTTGKILGFLNVPLKFGEVPAGGFGLVPWMITAGSGSVAVSSVETYPVTMVVCDGDSLTSGENDSLFKGTANPLGTSCPSDLQRLLGNRYHLFNLGRGGYTLPVISGDAASRVDALIAKAERPPIVVLEGGTNDFGIDGSVKPPMPVAKAVQTVYERLQGYWGARHAARADVRVVDVTNTPAMHPAYVRNLGSEMGFDQRRDALNALRKNTTTGPRPDYVADLTGDSSIGKDGSERNPRYFAAQDKTHLTDAGYAVKAGLIAEVIKAMK